MWKRIFGRHVFNVTTTTSTPSYTRADTTTAAYVVRAYAFAGLAPSAFAATECRKKTTTSENGQLLLINLSPSANAAISMTMCARGHSSWVLTPPSNASKGVDPFSNRIYLNGHLLPSLVDQNTDNEAGQDVMSPENFLEKIPYAAVTSTSCTMVLPPLSIAFVCYQ